MDQVYKSLSISQDSENILSDTYGHDLSIDEAGNIAAQDITCANITVSGTISGNIDGVINQTSVSAEEITLTGTDTLVSNGVLFKKADNKLYNDAGLTYFDSQAILSATNIETDTLKVATNALIAGDLSKASLYAHGQSAYRAISQHASTGDTTVDSARITKLVSQGTKGILVNFDPDETLHKNETHKFTNITGEPQLFIKPNSIGMGVESPIGRLHISSVGTCALRIDSLDPLTGGSRIVLAENGSTKSQIGLLANNDFFINEGNNYILYHNKDIDKTDLSGLLYIDAANSAVGVGTSSPGAKLDVLANTSEPAVKIQQTGSGDCLQIHDVANDTTRFAIDADGDVSIKRASKLGTSCLTMVGLENLSGVNSICFDTVHGQGGWDFWSKSMIMGGFVDRNTGQLTLANSNGPAALGAIFSSYFICDGGDTHIGSCNIAHTGDVVGGLNEISADYTRIFIDGLNGNVGINTVNPSAKLDVLANTSEPAVLITQSGSGDCLLVYDQANDTTPFIIKNDGNIGMHTHNPVCDLDLYTNFADDIARDVLVCRRINGSRLFNISKDTANHCYMDIKDSNQQTQVRLRGAGTNYINSGNLGIKTQSPLASLHIVDPSITTPTISTNTGLIIEDPTNYEGSAGGANFGNGVWFRADAQNRYTGSGSVIQTLAGIRAVYANLTLSDATQGSMGLEFYTSNGGNGANPPTANLAERMRLTHDGRLAVGTESPNTSAKLQINSTNSGFLPPRMTTAQKNAINSPATGLVVFDTTLNKLSCYNGSTWDILDTSAAATLNSVLCTSRVGGTAISNGFSDQYYTVSGKTITFSLIFVYDLEFETGSLSISTNLPQPLNNVGIGTTLNDVAAMTEYRFAHIAYSGGTTNITLRNASGSAAGHTQMGNQSCVVRVYGTYIAQ